MNPIVIPGATIALGAPANWDPETAGPCDALPVRYGVHADRHRFMESGWKPEPEELAALNAGGTIVLRIVSDIHPVVALYVIEEPVGEIVQPGPPSGEPA